jgi:hypothetical protein
MDTGLSPTTLYCYNISVYDAAGNESAQSSQACATTFALGYTVSGSVWVEMGEGGPPLAGVRITLSGTSFSFNTSTDLNGDYSFTDVQNGDYTIVPNRRGYYFDPVSYDIIVSGADVPFMDFGAYPDIDLEPTSASIVGTGIRYTVTNHGTANANNVIVWVEGDNIPSLVCAERTISVPARGTFTETVSTSPVTPTIYTIVVDPYDYVLESNESNNCLDLGGGCGSLPPPACGGG